MSRTPTATAGAPRRPFFLTSEFLLFPAIVAALLIAGALDEDLVSPHAWTLVAAGAAAYILSRGAAKRGSVGPASPSPSRPDSDITQESPVSRQPLRAPQLAPQENGEAAVTISEERVHVDKRNRPRERVRLRKYVVTEHVTITVPVQREEFRVERVPVDEADPDGAGSNGDAEITLFEEEPVIEKSVHARERVTLSKQVTTEDQQISEVVRREQVDVDTEAVAQPRATQFEPPTQEESR